MWTGATPCTPTFFFMLALSCGLTHPVTVDVATVGAWLTGRYSTNGIKTSERQDLERRAWDTLSWARQWIILPSGHRYALLDVGTIGFPEGVVQLVPFGWAAAKGPNPRGVHWRLTGAISHAHIRAAGDEQHRGDSLARFIAAAEDFLSASGSGGGSDRRARLLIPEKPGGPGPTTSVPYLDLLARGGWVWDGTDHKQANNLRNIWQRIAAALDDRGYRTPMSGSGETHAGDTVEVVDIVPGKGRRPGRVVFRASARFVEAQAKVSSPGRRRDDGLEHTPLLRLLRGS